MIKKALIIASLVAAYAYAAPDVIEVYRKQGVNAAIGEIERQLATKEYWKSYLKPFDVSLGFYEGDKFIIVTDKSRPEVRLFSYKNNKLSLMSRAQAKVGGQKGDKLSSGDLKTPTGSYDFVNKLGHLAPLYGPLAFATDYPNLYDIVNKKSGYGIWMHGMPLDNVRPPSTKGCVVVNNYYLTAIASQIDYHKTVMIIDDKPLVKTSKDDIATILAGMFQWKRAWERNDLTGYLRFYDERFRNYQGMDKTAYSTYKQRIFAKREAKRITFRSFEVTPNPTSTGEKIYKVKFYEEYAAPSYKFSGVKDLFVKVNNGVMTIVAER